MSIQLLIHKRRSIFPKSYSDRYLEKTTIQTILEAANWAPTHKMTEPWRFRIFHSFQSRNRLGNYMADWYKTQTPPDVFLTKKHQKLRFNATNSACVVAICMQRDPKERIPEWEEIAAVSAAVQNMHLVCTELKIGAYWSSTKAIMGAREFLQLGEGERCLGLFYMGYYDDTQEFKSKRTPIEDKVTWME